MAARVSTAGFSASTVGFLPVRVTLRVRDLLIASWPAERGAVERALPEGLEPAEVDGRLLVSLVSFRVEGGRLGWLPVPPYSQLNARTYATWRGDPAVYFLASRVTAFGLAGRVAGAPFRLARILVRDGTVRAPGLGLSLAYRVGEPAEVGSVGRHELGLFESRGLRAIRIVRGAADWRRAEQVEPVRADLLVALGFEPLGEPELLYCARTEFETEVPPTRLLR
jgi:uncharacterized protein DUF2071